MSDHTYTIALSSEIPTEQSFIEIDGDCGYARQSVRFDLIDLLVITNLDTVSFGPFTSARTIRGFAIKSRETWTWYGPLNMTRTVQITDAVVFPPGSIVIDIERVDDAGTSTSRTTQRTNHE